ncbi:MULTISPECIES: hypothetical protein [Bradyrhizobium]|uniref:hypothetical protein n=1 Tax=Bradyrhizobium TaxID=374 RepID=UPI0012FDDAD2|nr:MULTISPECIES: hypothetical protein [Bradyrhizobium]
MSQQNTGDESNPVHFSVNEISRRRPPKRFQAGFAFPRSSEMPGKAAPCPLSVQNG